MTEFLVSVVFALEGDTDFNVNLFKNIREQNYRNVEYVFVYAAGFNAEAFRTKIYEETDIDVSTSVRWEETELGIGMLDVGVGLAIGEVIFLRASNPNIWYPNHITSHLKKHEEAKFKESLVLSHVEYKNMHMNHKNPFATVGYRLNTKIQSVDILVDEISFTKDMRLPFNSFCSSVDAKGNIVEITDGRTDLRIVYNPYKLNEYVRKSVKNVRFTNSISVASFVQVPDKNQQPEHLLTQPEWESPQTIQSVTEDFTVRHRLPTLFGNTQLENDWNTAVRTSFVEQSPNIKIANESRIIVKRTIGMGDVIQAEPLLRYLAQTFPLSEIWLLTANARGCNDIAALFASHPKVIVGEELMLFKDALGPKSFPQILEANGLDPAMEFDVRIDLDMAYESRPGGAMRFVDAYFDVIGVKATDFGEKYLQPRLDFELIKPIVEAASERPAYVSVCLEGSGWQGKEVSVETAQSILESIKIAGLELVHTGTIPEKYMALSHLFDETNLENDFNRLLQLIGNSVGYVGADNGPMHIAAMFEKPILVWNGAADSTLTTPYKNITILKHEELTCLGCKHKIFYNLVPTGENQMSLSFVPACTNTEQYACMVKPYSDVEERIRPFLEKIAVSILTV